MHMLHHTCRGMCCVCMGVTHMINHIYVEVYIECMGGDSRGKSHMWRAEGSLLASPGHRAHVTSLAYAHSYEHSGSSAYAIKQTFRKRNLYLRPG